jgi:hypothetical protein
MKMIDVLMDKRRARRAEYHRAEAARTMRDLNYTYFGISRALGMPLTEVRRALDPRAERLHRKWRR